MSVVRPWFRAHRRAIWILAVACLALVALLVLEQRRRDSLYWYDVGADHRWKLERATTLPITVDANGFTLPELPPQRHTALLRLELDASWTGKWFEPSIDMRGVDGREAVQILERGARGVRYLNLSDLLDSPARACDRVHLEGIHVRWERQESELLLFARPDLQAGPLLVLAPHPDDAEIAAFGLYASTENAWVVTLTSGHGVDSRMADLVPDPAERSRLKGEIRSWDSVAVPLWGGVPAERTANLGYFTLSLEEMRADPERPFADEILGTADIQPFRRAGDPALLAPEASSTWSSLVRDLRTILERLRPQTVVTPHPALDAAVDHQLTTVALLEAMAEVDADPELLLLYTNHHVVSEYFPFGPAEGLVSLPPWTAEPLPLDALYSHRLDDLTRLRKLYALEAQHDLRPAPRFVSPGPIRHVFGEFGNTLGRLWRDPTDTYSYLRRGPRPNEIFFVLSTEKVGTLQLDTHDESPLSDWDYTP